MLVGASSDAPTRVYRAVVRTRRLGIGVAAIGLLVALAGCGTSSIDASVSIKTLQAAADNTQSAESYRYDIEETVRSNGETVTITGTGTTSEDGKASTVYLDIPKVGSIEYRLIDRVIYMDASGFPALASQLPAGKQWVSIDLDTLAGGDLDQLYESAQSSSPNSGLKFLDSLSGDPENLGTETVNGQRTTHYRGTLDYRKLGDKIKDEKVKAQLAKLGPVPVDVWIDGDDHVVKMHMKLDAAAFSSTAPDGSVELTMTISDIDEPVVVVAPPADQVVDFSSLFGKSGVSV
jgi:hypothetical protein